MVAGTSIKASRQKVNRNSGTKEYLSKCDGRPVNAVWKAVQQLYSIGSRCNAAVWGIPKVR